MSRCWTTREKQPPAGAARASEARGGREAGEKLARAKWGVGRAQRTRRISPFSMTDRKQEDKREHSPVQFVRSPIATLMGQFCLALLLCGSSVHMQT